VRARRARASGNAESSREDGLGQVTRAAAATTAAAAVAAAAAVVVVVVVVVDDAATSTATRRRARIETAEPRVLELSALSDTFPLALTVPRFLIVSPRRLSMYATRRHATPRDATPRERNGNGRGIA